MRKGQIQDLGRERIIRLFELAEEDFGRSNRYMQLVRKISTRNRIRIPSHLKSRMCKECHSLLIPGRNARVRLRGDRITTTCLTCGKQMRCPYKRRK